MPTTARIFNFSAGPAVLPLPVLEQAQRELVSLPGVGMSVMEISHRSKTFEDLLNGAIADIRELANVPANYRLLIAAHYLNGVQYDGLAEALQLPLGTIKTQLFRAKQQLRRMLETDLR